MPVSKTVFPFLARPNLPHVLVAFTRLAAVLERRDVDNIEEKWTEWFWVFQHLIQRICLVHMHVCYSYSKDLPKGPSTRLSKHPFKHLAQHSSKHLSKYPRTWVERPLDKHNR